MCKHPCFATRLQLDSFTQNLLTVVLGTYKRVLTDLYVIIEVGFFVSKNGIMKR